MAVFQLTPTEEAALWRQLRTHILMVWTHYVELCRLRKQPPTVRWYQKKTITPYVTEVSKVLAKGQKLPKKQYTSLIQRLAGQNRLETAQVAVQQLRQELAPKGSKPATAALQALSQAVAVRNKLMQKHLPLVQLLIGRLKRTEATGDLELQELMQSATFGLAVAIERFEPQRGTRFSKYAKLWICQAAREAAREGGYTIRLPADVATALQQFKRDPAIIKTRQPHIKIENLEQLNRIDRLDELDDHNCPGCNPVQDQALVQKQLAQVIQKDLARSGTATRQYILTRYYGLDRKPPETLATIGKHLGASRQAVHQQLKLAHKELKKHLGTQRDTLRAMGYDVDDTPPKR